MKVKKLITGLVIAGAMTVSGVALAGCGESAAVESSYNMVSLQSEYDIDDQVSFVGKTIEIEMSDGSKKQISITEDMVKTLPDMSSVGDKTLVITYNGKDYSFTFKVTDKKSDIIAKLNEFLEHYNLKQKKGDVSVGIGYSITSNFMGEKANAEDSMSSSLTYEQVKDNELVKYIYNTILDRVVKTTTDIDKSDITNANDFKIKNDVIENIAAILNSMTENDATDFTKTLINFVFGNLTNVNEISEYVSQALCITSAKGKAEVYSLVNSAIVKVKSLEEVDLLKLVSDLNEIVKANADQKPISMVIGSYLKLDTEGQKQLETLVYDTIRAYTNSNKENYTVRGQFNKLQNIVNAHSTDTTVKEVFETVVDTIDYTGDNLISDTLRSVLMVIKNSNNDEFLEAFSNCLCDVIKEIEDAVEASKDVENFNIMTTYTNIYNKLNTFVSSKSTFENLTDLDNRIFDIATGFKDIFDCADQNILTFLLNIYKKFDFAQMLVSNYELPTQVADVIDNLVNDLLTQNTEINYGNYIDLICGIFGIDSAKAQEYKDDFETNHKCNLVSDILSSRLDTEIEVFAKIVDLVKYAEDNLGKDTFSRDEILLKASDLATAVKGNEDLLTRLGLSEKVFDDINTIIDNLRSTTEEVDYKNFVTLVCDILNINGTQINGYITDLIENHKCNIISDYLAYMLDTTNSENAMIVDLVKYAEDNLGKDTFELNTLFNKINALATYLKTQNILPAVYDPLLTVATCFTNSEQTVEENFKDLLKIYKTEIVNVTTNVLTMVIVPNDLVGANDVTETREYNEFKSLIDYNLSRYLNNEDIDGKKFIKDFANIVNLYANEDSKVVIQSLALAFAVISGPQEGVDYNEFMSFYKLPDEIEAIDYNKLIEKLHDDATYENLFKISDLDVQFVTDAEGNITKEILTLNLSSDFDCLITNYSANLKLSFEILF